jgi:hypothetical protein
MSNRQIFGKEFRSSGVQEFRSSGVQNTFADKDSGGSRG